jgi:hypothetical protein
VFAALPGAKVLDGRTVELDPSAAGASPCTRPFTLGAPIGVHAFELTTRGSRNGDVDADRFRIRCDPPR